MPDLLPPYISMFFETSGTAEHSLHCRHITAKKMGDLNSRPKAEENGTATVSVSASISTMRSYCARQTDPAISGNSDFLLGQMLISPSVQPQRFWHAIRRIGHKDGHKNLLTIVNYAQTQARCGLARYGQHRIPTSNRNTLFLCGYFYAKNIDSAEKSLSGLGFRCDTRMFTNRVIHRYCG